MFKTYLLAAATALLTLVPAVNNTNPVLAVTDGHEDFHTATVAPAKQQHHITDFSIKEIQNTGLYVIVTDYGIFNADVNDGSVTFFSLSSPDTPYYGKFYFKGDNLYMEFKYNIYIIYKY